jgi:hypothetical protein
VLDTGDTAYPALVVGGGRADLFATSDGRLHRLVLPFPPRDVLAAAIHGGKLFLGTSGLGLLHARLEDLLPAGGPAATAAGSAVAGGGR